MASYRLSAPDGRYEDAAPPIIAEQGEISDRVGQWLETVGVARPLSKEDELHERLTHLFSTLSPQETASAILGLCPDAATVLADKQRVWRTLSQAGDRS